MKKLILLLTMMAILIVALSCTSVAFAEETEAVETEAIETTEQVETIETDETETWFNNLWNNVKEWAIAFGSGISIAGIGSAIAYAVIKSTTQKTMNKITTNYNADTIANMTSDKMLQKWSNVALDVNIKPLMESQYKALNEQINAEFKLDLQKQDQKTLATLEAIEKLGAYFDCSIAVSDEAKADFKETIEKAKALYTSDTKVSATIEIVAEAPKETKKAKVVENY